MMLFPLENYGVLKFKLPQELHSLLYEECVGADRTRSKLQDTHRCIKTGLTNEIGVAVHYYLKDVNTADMLKKYVLSCAEQYLKEFEFVTINELKDSERTVDGIHAREPWINIQHKHEYLPNHTHTGNISYSLWMKIPYVNETGSSGRFEFTYNTLLGNIIRKDVKLDKDMEGTLMMFPSKLQHCAYPFYTSDESRISISGNIGFDYVEKRK
jgi:hypothetical protein